MNATSIPRNLYSIAWQTMALGPIQGWNTVRCAIFHEGRRCERARVIDGASPNWAAYKAANSPRCQKPLGIEGTWRRDCTMLDVSASGVQLLIKGSIAGLDLKEFFLLLSSTGLAYRRCELARIDGEQIGARFLQPSRKKATSSLSKRQHAESEH